MRDFTDPNVAAVFESYSKGTRERLLALRQLIFETAESTDGVGALEETLKWGQPSYLTSETGSGTTIRIDSRESADQYAMYVHCQTTLVDSFRSWFPNEFQFEGTRAVVFRVDEEPAVGPLSVCIGAALTYHLDKKRRAV